EALGRLSPLPGSAVAALETLAQDSTTSVARAAQTALGCRADAESPTPTPVAKAGMVPAELGEYAAAVRAFLLRWRSGLGDGCSELARAVDTVVRALGT